MGITLYEPGDTWLHRLDPMTKLLMAGASVILAFAASSPAGGALLLVVLLTVLATGRVLRRSVPVLLGVAFVAATFLLVQGLVHPDNAVPWARLGPFVLYREGLAVGMRLTFRLYNIMAASFILVLATNPSRLTEALVRRGLPPRGGYVIAAMLQVVPAMVSTVRSITDAQRSRGMETEGSLWIRMRAFIPLMGPLVTGSLIATEERALALEARGFGGGAKPVYLYDESVPSFAGPVRVVAVAAAVAGVAARWIWGF